MDKALYEKQKKQLTLIFFGVMAFSIISVALSGYIIYNSFCNSSDRGTFGDMFGMINSLFSGLAFAGIIYTILLQRIDLELQRDEIAKSTKELEGQRLALDRQNFENKFFQMINLHHQIVNEIHENWQHRTTPVYNDKREIFGNAAIWIMRVYDDNAAYKDFKEIERLILIYQNEVYQFI